MLIRINEDFGENSIFHSVKLPIELVRLPYNQTIQDSGGLSSKQRLWINC